MVIMATESHLSEHLELGDEVHMRAWVLKVNRLGSTPIREWTVAPTGLRLTSINHETGEVTAEVRDAKAVAPRTVIRETSPAHTFRPKRLMRPAALSGDHPIFVGLQQALRPESDNPVSAPIVLAIAEDHGKVTSEVRARYLDQGRLSTLCSVNFWVLEAHQGWSRPHEHWVVAPAGVEVAEIGES